MPEMFLGVGTIKTLQQAEGYLNIGADFLVSPGLIPRWWTMRTVKIFFMRRVV
jgi:2-keto-3-deoxy-6-phosphogluconate aldolase